MSEKSRTKQQERDGKPVYLSREEALKRLVFSTELAKGAVETLTVIHLITQSIPYTFWRRVFFRKEQDALLKIATAAKPFADLTLPQKGIEEKQDERESSQQAGSPGQPDTAPGKPDLRIVETETAEGDAAAS